MVHCLYWTKTDLLITGRIYNKWHRKPINSPFEVGVKYTGNQLKAFFEWYVNTGGQAIPF